MIGSRDRKSKNISSWLKTITTNSIIILTRRKGGIINQIYIKFSLQLYAALCLYPYIQQKLQKDNQSS